MNGTQVTPGGGGARADISDRATAAIRPVDPAQQAALSDFFAALSVETRYRRFFAPVRPTVDAIVAVADGVIVGHAMAADLPERICPDASRVTDVGVVVADAWQRRGVGAALMRALIARAQARGVTALAMDVLPGNRRVLAMILGHWPDADVGHSPDGIDIQISLPPAQPGRRPASTRGPPLVP